jgi:hypothetical protein
MKVLSTCYPPFSALHLCVKFTEERIMGTVFEELELWLTKARAKLEGGAICTADLDELSQIIHAKRTSVRQRLLYLHATTPNICSQVIGMAEHEPVAESITEITTEGDQWPYRSVHDAILDGWQVIHFPDQRVPFDDQEIDILGYEFILQKLEAYNE